MSRIRLIMGVMVSALIAIGATVLGGAPAMAASPQVNQTYVDSSGVVHYMYDPAVRPGATIRTETGKRDGAGGCLFSGEGSGGPADATVTVVDEVTFDPATCSRTVSVAIYPRSATPAKMAVSIAPQTESSDSSTASSPKPGVVVAAATWSQKLSAWVGDPVGIHVSETNITRTWSSSGTWNNNHNWGWYSPTGWSRTAYSQVDSSTVGDTIGTFVNWAFCNPFASTTDQHYKTRLTTNTSGGWSWSYSMNKSGDCSELLSYHYALG